MHPNTTSYLIIWDKPGTKSESGRFYRKIKTKGAAFIQRSVYSTSTLKSALELAGFVRSRGFKVLVFQARRI
ncbi:MAG: hypothetical protein QXN56_01145 [Candidatus Hadarchaeum sp.]